MPGFDGGAHQTFQIRYRLSTDKIYSYENVPSNAESFGLKNLRLGSKYHISVRSNNSRHLSQWTDEIIVSTLSFMPLVRLHSSETMPSAKISFTVIIIVIIVGLIILFINMILILIFITKRRRSNVTSENSSTAEINETEPNTFDIFRPIPSNLFLTTPNTNKKYEEDNITRSFVSSCSSAHLLHPGKFCLSISCDGNCDFEEIQIK